MFLVSSSDRITKTGNTTSRGLISSDESRSSLKTMALETFNASRTNVSHFLDNESVMNGLFVSELVPIATMIVIANVVVFALFARKRELRTPTNLFLLSLSISDCANGLVNIPVFLAILALSLSRAGDVAVIVLHNFTLTLTAFHILAITADKYFAIMKPFRRRSSLTKYFVAKTIVAVWLISATVSALEIPVANISPTIQSRIYLLFNFIAVFVLPFAFMFYAYVVMFYTLRKRKTLAQRRHDTQVCKHLLSDWKCLLIFTTMFVVFLICWCPSFAIKMVLGFVDPQEWMKSDQFRTVMYVFTIIRYCSSVLNPLLYTLLKTDFITALKTFTRSSSDIERRSSTEVTRRDRINNTSQFPLKAAKYNVRKPAMLEQWEIAVGTDKAHLTPSDTEYEIQLLTVI